MVCDRLLDLVFQRTSSCSGFILCYSQETIHFIHRSEDPEVIPLVVTFWTN